MPGATVARFVLWLTAMPIKLFMMPHTVPNRPTNGATAPMLASKPMPCVMARTWCGDQLFLAKAGPLLQGRRRRMRRATSVSSCCTSSSSSCASEDAALASFGGRVRQGSRRLQHGDGYAPLRAAPCSKLAPFTSKTTQVASAATSKPMSTLLTTWSAAKNMPSGDMSCGKADGLRAGCERVKETAPAGSGFD